MLLAHAGLPDHEVSVLAAQLRARMLARWSDYFGARDVAAARALVWGLVNATLGAGDLVDAGELTVEEALAALAVLFRAASEQFAGPRSG